MNEETKKALGKPKNDMEREILERITPLIDDEAEKRIKEKKLTISGCLTSCFDKGKKFEVKSGRHGVARISEEQHFKWVFEYFGITGDVATPHISETKPTAGKLALDLDSLFE